MRISKEFSFDSAHFLTHYHGKCERLHGHTYRLRVTVEGPVQEDGMVLDFADLKRVVKAKVVDLYDHQCLNDFFENPSAERIAEKIWEEVAAEKTLFEGGARLVEVRLWETPDSFVTYTGD